MGVWYWCIGGAVALVHWWRCSTEWELWRYGNGGGVTLVIFLFSSITAMLNKMIMFEIIRLPSLTSAFNNWTRGRVECTWSVSTLNKFASHPVLHIHITFQKSRCALNRIFVSHPQTPPLSVIMCWKNDL